MRYTVPTITPAKSYITEFQGIDVAIGFDSKESIKQYLGDKSGLLAYDIVLIDTDNIESIKNYEMISDYKNLFVTRLWYLFAKKRIRTSRGNE